MPAAVITGGARGIGRAIAIQYARDGYDVAINYRRSADAAVAAAAEVRETTDSAAAALQADVSDPAAASALIEATVERFGDVAHVVNNAGVNEHRYPEELSPEGFDRVMDTNVNSAFAVSKAALPHLRQHPDREGSIVNLSSRLAFDGADYECHYAASKAAIVALTKSLARAFAPAVRVNAVAPGYVVTDMTDANNSEADKERRREAIPVGRLGRPEDVATAAAYLRDARYVTGETAHVNGGQLMR
ncbi:SDR family NAD(P)-dependent oxidoreductase [Halomarina halobia]|uniref:SDR family NAD(P)-dependent oxidoreductase n=1 Tax=Halomarina halobia TaxID=3033386 RepID=A0ABD6ADS0_9EURY|nr:SDR family oxidoreductase [Halomarina sp. PSR21]